ncbi:MAG TPA: ABC transporter permease [Verrucomicrobiae bacterium]|nr:ABC transporter permease [Verrucomicrobiae bacterium]
MLRVKALFRRRAVEEELDEELRFHFDQQVRKLIESGMPLAEAQRRARMTMGGEEQIKEECRDERGVRFVESLAQDVRFGLRSLRKSPGFTAVAIITLMLGIGVNTALFTVVYGVLLNPLPFPRPDRLVSLWEENVIETSAYNPVSGGVFTDWQSAAKSFEQMALVGEDTANLSGDGGALPESIGIRQCSYSLFALLGVQPAQGRFFTEQDDQHGAAPTTVLTNALWKRRYGSDPTIIGKTILLDGQKFVVIGVLPAWFDYPDKRVQLWVPVRQAVSEADMRNRGNHRFFVTARLKDGVSVAQASSELNGIQQRNYAQFPKELMGKNAQALLLSENLVRDVKQPLYLLLGAVGCLLLIACLNVANLFMARVTARRRELAVRSALGGSRGRIVQEQVTESLLVTFAGGALGTVLAWVTLRWLLSFQADLPHADAIHVDGTALGFTLATTIFCGMFAGLLPALAATRQELAGSLKEDSRTMAGGQARARLRKALLTAEVALTVVLLVGGALLLKSFAKLRSVDVGCRTDNELTMGFTLPDARYGTEAKLAEFYAELLQRVRSVPGVSHAAVVSVLPGAGHFMDNTFTIEGAPPLPPGQFRNAVLRGADPDYFVAMHIPLKRGRVYTDADRRTIDDNAMVITESMAQKFFPGEDPLGKHLVIDWERRPRFEIVGVVGDVLSNLDSPPEATMYLPLNSGRFDYGSLVAMTDPGHDVTALAMPLQKQIAALDPDLGVSDVLTMDERIGKSTASAMFDALLVLSFAALGLVLAAVGLYGLLSYLVTERTNEIGIRMALGAQRFEVMRIMFVDGLRPTVVGLAIGLLGGGICAQLIRSGLFGVEPLDWKIFGTVALVVLAIAGAACTYPAWRAARVDPMTALRCE